MRYAAIALGGSSAAPTCKSAARWLLPEMARSMRKEYNDVTLAELLRHESGLLRDAPVQAQNSRKARRSTKSFAYKGYLAGATNVSMHHGFNGWKETRDEP